MCLNEMGTPFSTAVPHKIILPGLGTDPVQQRDQRVHDRLARSPTYGKVRVELAFGWSLHCLGFSA